MNCLCCGEGLLEIKCPFKHRNVDPVNITDDTFFLHFTEDGLHLKLDHSYYYQVQGQLAVCEKDYCDFVCWTKKGMHVERIARNEHFFNMFAPKLEEVFFQYILPEVMTKNLLASDKPGSSYRVLHVPLIIHHHHLFILQLHRHHHHLMQTESTVCVNRRSSGQ